MYVWILQIKNKEVKMSLDDIILPPETNYIFIGHFDIIRKLCQLQLMAKVQQSDY